MSAITVILLLTVILVLLTALLLFVLAQRTRSATGLPEGRVVYGDTSAWNRVEEPLMSRRHGLVGKPDYLVETSLGSRRVVIPVEVKSRPRPETPYPGHILQLGAYCLLVEDRYRIRPPYGLLRYADATIEISYDDALRRAVLTAAAEIRAARRASYVGRDHDDAARCRNCGYLAACGEDAL